MKYILLIIYSCCIMFFSPLFAVDDYSTAEEMEAQKDMAAFMQYSVQYRFNSDLKVGDKVEYKLANSESDETIYELEVTEKTKDGMWIIEKFNGNEVHMLVDTANEKLLDLWGYDENGKKQEPELLDETEVIDRVNEMVMISEQTDISDKWEQSQTSETFHLVGKQIACKYVESKIPENMPKEETRIYFSEDVPTLTPFQIAISSLSFLNLFKTIDGGFVRNNILELKYFNKVK